MNHKRKVQIKAYLQSLKTGQIIAAGIALLSLALFLTITLWTVHKQNDLPDQYGAERWDNTGKSAQVSCFLSENAGLDELQILNFEHELEEQLEEILPEEASGEEGKRLVVDAYSTSGTITISSERAKIETSAIGIGGDFFLFHPLTLVSGSYFSGNDLMKDGIILDEEAAWQLFGSSHVEGEMVMIENVPHYIAGVVERPQGKLAEKAGLDQMIVYLSYESLCTYGTGGAISTYEVMAPNPVKHFVYSTLQEKLGVDEKEMLVVENSSRFSLGEKLGVLLDFETRSMQNQTVKIPYWENMARAVEDMTSLALVFQLLFLLIPTVMLMIFLIRKWKHRSFTGKDVANGLSNLIEKIKQKIPQRPE
jgi:hypothetical protein